MRRREDVVAECEKWRAAFECGTDWFNELDGLDPAGRFMPDAERAAAEARFLSAVREAWQRLGVAFMKGWTPYAHYNVGKPWALKVFGDPAGKLRNPRTLRR